MNPDPRDLVSKIIDGVGIIPCWHLEEVMYGEVTPSFEQIKRDLRYWCEMYAVGFHDTSSAVFSVDVDVEMAKEANQRYLIVQDLL